MSNHVDDPQTAGDASGSPTASRILGGTRLAMLSDLSAATSVASSTRVYGAMDDARCHHPID